jgi:hypothetical protein
MSEHTTRRPRQPTRSQQRRRASLTAGLTTARHMWTQPSELGFSVQEIDGMARQHGLGIVRSYGDRRDPLLLLSRTPIDRPADLADTTKMKPPSPNLARWMSIPLLAFALLLAGIAIAIAIGAGAPLAVVAAFVVVAAPFALLPVWFIVRDTTHTVHQRVSVMLRTFDGRPHLVVANHLYKLDPAAICEIAAELGYAYAQTGTVVPTPWVMLSSTEHWMHFVLAPQPPVS